MLPNSYHQEITRFQVPSAIVDGRKYVLKLGMSRDEDACGSFFGDETRVNESHLPNYLLVLMFMILRKGQD